MTGRPRSASVLHTAAIVASLLVFALIFTYTGDADLFFAVGSGLGAAIVIYLGAHLAGGGVWRN
jgi:peptidoglycan/LPS O-acetylase OafA/YrhL